MKIRALAGSLPLLLGATALLIGAMVLSIVPASGYIVERSSSLTDNFYIIGGLMALIVLAAFVQGLLVVRLVWGPAAASDSNELGEADDGVIEMRAMRVTGTKKALVFFVLVVLNTVVLDQIGGGVLVSDTRTLRVFTLLRSKNGQDRADAVHDAILLTGDDRIARALQKVIEEAGEAREWAAYAAGIRHDKSVADSIVRLLKTGTPRERAASAVALARLKDDRLMYLVPAAYSQVAEHRGSPIMALGMLGKVPTATKADLEVAGDFLAGLLGDDTLDKELRRVVVWALGRLEAPAGLAPIERLLESAGDSGTLCTGLEALGKIGAAETSPRLIKAIHEMDRSVYCPEMVYSDFTGDEVLICTGINLIERLLHEIAHIGDRRARPEMEKLAKDESFSKTVRSMAAEIAFQMKYKHVPE